MWPFKIQNEHSLLSVCMGDSIRLKRVEDRKLKVEIASVKVHHLYTKKETHAVHLLKYRQLSISNLLIKKLK